jgi:hypothetical protein
MVLHVASAVARRRVASMASQQIQRRNMGSGPKPEWTGIDKTVRDIFPEDWQLAAAILGGYSSLIGIAVLRSKMNSTPPAPVVETVKISETPTTTDASGIPSVDSPEFDAYVDSKAFMMLLENDSQLTELTNSM